MRRKSVLAIAAGILAAAALLLSQAVQQPRPLSDLFPAGPLIYVEAKDLATALKDWNSSRLKTGWTGSDNYKVFSQSRLFMRLDQAQQEYAAAAGFAPDMSLAEAVSGTNSALALYDIGELGFLYITRMPQARAYQSILWQSRAKFQPRRSAGIDYYIRQQQQRRAAFAVTSDLLLVATDEQALAGALALIAGQSPPAMQQETWFRNAIAAQTQPGDFRMVHNFARVLRTPYFRSYWVQKNTRDLTQFSVFIADLDRSPAEFRERRSLLRDEPSTDLRPAEPAVAEALRYVPAEAGLFRAWARPEIGAVMSLVMPKLVPGRGEGADRRQAPAAVHLDTITGTEQDVEVRIDEPALLSNTSTGDFDPLRRLLAENATQAAVQVGIAQPGAGAVFITTPGAVILLGERAWDLAAARAAVEAVVSNVWTISGLGTGWNQTQNVWTLSGLGKTALAASGRILIIGDSADLVRSMLARAPNIPTGTGAAYSARYLHTQELPKFEAMMRLMDAPALRASSGNTREPLFFSENVASLGRALEPVDSLSIESHDDGRAVTQTVVYKLR